MDWHLLADGDALTGGGIVGGVVTAAGALYVIWEKASKRRTEARRELLADAEQQLKLDEMARKSLTAAFEEERAARRAAHDADIARVRRAIRRARKRLAELESREQRCQQTCAEQAAEMAGLRAEIQRLKVELRGTGALPPGTSHHEPLKG